MVIDSDSANYGSYCCGGENRDPKSHPLTLSCAFTTAPAEQFRKGDGTTTRSQPTQMAISVYDPEVPVLAPAARRPGGQFDQSVGIGSNVLVYTTPPPRNAWIPAPIEISALPRHPTSDPGLVRVHPGYRTSSAWHRPLQVSLFSEEFGAFNHSSTSSNDLLPLRRRRTFRSKSPAAPPALRPQSWHRRPLAPRHFLGLATLHPSPPTNDLLRLFLPQRGAEHSPAGIPGRFSPGTETYACPSYRRQPNRPKGELSPYRPLWLRKSTVLKLTPA